MKLTILIGSVLAAMAGTACTAKAPAPGTDVPSVAVSLERVEVGDVTSPVEAGGVVRARATAVIASRMMAPVAEVHVRPGDRVRRAEKLVTLDARETQANRARAAAALAAAQETVRAAESDVRAAEERISALASKRSATPQELDQALAGLNGAEAQLGARQAHVAAAIAARDAERASLDAADVTASYALISAPFDGVITERTVDPGSMAVPGAPLLTLEDPTQFRLEVQLDEARAAAVSIGQTVDVLLDQAGTSTDNWHAGHVVEVARVDPASHSFLVKIDVPSAATIRSGLFGRARFAGPVRGVLTVPSSALLRRGQLTFVFMVDADSRARLRPVSAGAVTRDRVEALAGIQAGDTVVTNPPVSLSDGARVTSAALSRNAPVASTGDVR